MQGIEVYQDNTDKIVLDQFIEDHRQLVRKIALHLRRRLPSYVELEDLFQAGFIGLLEARNNYKTNMNTTFETFASYRIRGAIIDSLRKNTWGSRETLKNMRMINDAINKIEQRKQTVPTTEDIAAELGISVEEYFCMCQQISINNVISIDSIDEDDTTNTDIMQNPEELSEKENIIQQIKLTIANFPEREQIVLSLYYVEEFTFKQIGEILDLTEARICQLHSQAISRLKGKLKQDK